MPRTILYTVCFSDFYGTQRNVLAAARRLDPVRYRPIVSAPEGDVFFSELNDSGITVFPLPFKSVADYSTAFALGRIIRDNDVSLIHAHLGISVFLSLLASRMSGGVPAVATRHFIADRYATIASKALYRFYLGLYRRMNARLARVIFVSEAVRRGVESREGSFGARGVVIPNSIDISGGPVRRTMSSGEIAGVRAKFGAPADCFLIVTLSRLVAEKRLDTLLEAAALLKNKGSKFFFIIAGDGPLRGDLEAMAEKLRIRDKIRFSGYVREARELVAAADASVLSAQAEPFGIAVLEAMAGGVPVVSARSGGPLEIIKDGESGLFFDPGDAADLADKLLELAEDTGLRERLADNALARVADFDESSIALRIQSVYDEVLAEK